MDLNDFCGKVMDLFFYNSNYMDAEITDVRVNDNGKWIELELDGMKEVIKID